jgi:hypothetical protein
LYDKSSRFIDEPELSHVDSEGWVGNPPFLLIGLFMGGGLAELIKKHLKNYQVFENGNGNRNSTETTTLFRNHIH